MWKIFLKETIPSQQEIWPPTFGLWLLLKTKQNNACRLVCWIESFTKSVSSNNTKLQ